MEDDLGNWRRTHYSEELNADIEEDVTIAGWVHEIRDLGGVMFLIIRDRKGKVQVTLPEKKVKDKLMDKISEISKESVLMVQGQVKEDERAPGGLEVLPKEIKVLSDAETPLPIDVAGEVNTELDNRLNSRFLDLRNPETLSVFKIRDKTFTEVRKFLEKEGFIEMTSPKMVATATEGGTELFPISYFEKEAFLNQSPQLFKQIMMASGLDKVYEIGPIFRAEEHDTRRHLNETTSIDIEMAFSDHTDVMGILERLINYVYEKIEQECSEELKKLDKDLKPPELPFERIKYDEAVDICNKKGIEITWGEDFPTPGEKAIGEEIGDYYFIVDWPSEIKPFYAQPKEEKEISKAFDLMHPEFELSSGAQRVHSIELLKKRMINQDLEPSEFKFYLDAFKYGMPPHSGWGLGAERLLMAITGKPNIREVVLFPRDRKRLIP
ncbi:MAG: Aspartyl/asparaginyl-tRNA synthetase [Candidatus Methanohalarchaeum thermophilum]|uniref:Aspartate--tRNA(Asp/Asn) ligase n=1 Tax=Methanohalarchaeum thermophilum TaxID=1903181 RepID=A0A1Q6DXE8_METT1|nr:MAG: Aspartyl/asparaginyl-tRNA synthetase [Candidatus Methanohalarchaeum thermophilum]